MKTKRVLAALSAILMTAAIGTAAAPVGAADAWRESYRGILKNFQKDSNKKYYTYRMIDIDKNGVPELAVNGEFAEPCYLYTYQDGALVTLLDSTLTEAIASRLTANVMKNSNSYWKVGNVGAYYYISFSETESAIALTAQTGDPSNHFLIPFDYANGVLTLQTTSYEGDIEPADMYRHDGDTVTKVSVDEFNQARQKWGYNPGTSASISDYSLLDSWLTTEPVTEAPTTEASTTEAPATEAPTTEAPATEAPATEAPAAPDYGTMYSNYVYNTLIPEKGQAELSTVLTPTYDLNKLFGVVSSAVYDFEKDGTPELLVVTRELLDRGNGNSSANYANTTFYLNLYGTDADGNVTLLDRMATADDYSVSCPTGEQSDAFTLALSGGAVLETSRTSRYGTSGPHAVCNEYAVYGVSGGKFNKYRVSVDTSGVYDSTNVRNDSFAGTVLYMDKALITKNDSASAYTAGKFTSEADVIAEISNQFKARGLETGAMTLSKEEDALHLNFDAVDPVTLVSYQFPVYDADTSMNSLKHSMTGTMIAPAAPVTPVVTEPVATSETNSTTNSNSKSNSNSNSNSSSNSNKTTTKASSSGSTSGTTAAADTKDASPATGDSRTPLAAGAAALAALAAGMIFRKRK